MDEDETDIIIPKHTEKKEKKENKKNKPTPTKKRVNIMNLEEEE